MSKSSFSSFAEDMKAPGASGTADHLCVLVHGLWGIPAHLTNVAKVLQEKHPRNRLCILVTTSNAGNFTYDGISLGGQRLCHEIEEELENLEKAGHGIKKLSVVGYSLGGLLARYAIGLLYSRGLFEKLKPINFTTFATPHLGARIASTAWLSQGWNFFGARVVSTTGQQLFLNDDYQGTGTPLLAIMADQNSIFMKGLAKFKYKALYANIVRDFTVAFYTSSISSSDPFTNLDMIKINYLEGSENVLLDPNEPVTLLNKKASTPDSSWFHYAQNLVAMIRTLAFNVMTPISLSIAAVFFLCYSLVQNVLSWRRIWVHEAGMGKEFSKIPFLVGIQEAVENVQESLKEELEAISLESSSPLVTKVSNPLPGGNSTSTDSQLHDLCQEPPTDGPKELSNGNYSFEAPSLDLTAHQYTMIEALDSLGWKKYFVHFHKTRRAHPAIVVRKNKHGYDEGWIVLRHWVDDFFLE